MSTPTWNRLTSGNYTTSYHGLNIRINLDSRGEPVEILWFCGGRLDSSSPLKHPCSLHQAQRIAVTVVDELIESNPVWLAAERRERENAFLRR